MCKYQNSKENSIGPAEGRKGEEGKDAKSKHYKQKTQIRKVEINVATVCQ